MLLLIAQYLVKKGADVHAKPSQESKEMIELVKEGIMYQPDSSKQRILKSIQQIVKE